MTTEPTGAIDMHNYEPTGHLPEIEIQRWVLRDKYMDRYQPGEGEAHDSGEWVIYADHVAAVAEAEGKAAMAWRRDGDRRVAAALDAARDAVAALIDEYEGLLKPGVAALRNALAAIDGLTNGQKEA